MRTKRLTFVGIVAVLGLLSATPNAAATFPGRNGLIAFSCFRCPGGSDEYTEGEVFVVEPDGTGLRLLLPQGARPESPRAPDAAANRALAASSVAPI